MQIQSAKYLYGNQDIPVLEIELLDNEGQSGIAQIWEPKPTLLEEGFVFLHKVPGGTDWEHVLPPLDLPQNASTGRRAIQLKGFTNDSTIIKLARDYFDAINNRNGKHFEEGTVDVPKG